MGFSRQESWSGLPFPYPEDLPDPGIKPLSPAGDPALVGRFFTTEPLGKPFSAGDLGSIPGSRRAHGEGNGNPLQYSCLENSVDRGAWLATVHGVKESDTTEPLTLSLSMNTSTPDLGF